MGREHARVVSESGLARVTWVVDRDWEAARAVQASLPTLETAQCAAWLRDAQGRDGYGITDVDAAILALPTALHAPCVVECARRGWHVLVEKPLADTAAAATSLVGDPVRARVVVAVGHTERFNPAVRALRAFVDADTLGPLVRLSGWRLGYHPGSRAASYGDPLLDLGSHEIDVFRHLGATGPATNAATTISADCAEAMWWAPRRDNTGVLCSLHVGWTYAGRMRRLVAEFKNAIVEVDYAARTLAITDRLGPPRVEPVRYADPLTEQFKTFVASVRENRVLEPLATLADGVAVVEAIDALRAAAR